MVSDKKWPGTVRYDKIIDEYADKYCVLIGNNHGRKNQTEMTKLAKSVIEWVKPGRFLTSANPKNDMRSVMDEDDICIKNSQSIL